MPQSWLSGAAYLGLCRLRRNRRELILQALGAVAGVTLAAARDVRLFYPLFVPVTWIALRHGVPGAMIGTAHTAAWNPGRGADPRAVTHTTPRVGSVGPPDGSA